MPRQAKVNSKATVESVSSRKSGRLAKRASDTKTDVTDSDTVDTLRQKKPRESKKNDVAQTEEEPIRARSDEDDEKLFDSDPIKEYDEELPNGNNFTRKDHLPECSNSRYHYSGSPEEEEIMESEIILMYPPKQYRSKRTETVELRIKDLISLELSKMINDQIMAFYLSRIEHVVVDKELKEKSYFANSFLFSALTVDLRRKTITDFVEPEMFEDKLQKGYRSVYRWTRKDCLFEKELIVLPIHEEYHWMIAVIINPKGMITSNKDEKSDSTHIVWLNSMPDMDSRRSGWFQRIVTTYLRMEFEDKKSSIFPRMNLAEDSWLDTSRAVSIRPHNLPVQGNLLDCGPYVLHFIETFLTSKVAMKRPFENFDWKKEFPTSEHTAKRMRYNILANILNAADKQKRRRIFMFAEQNDIEILLCNERKRGTSEVDTRERIERPTRSLSYFENDIEKPCILGNNSTIRKIREIEPPFGVIPQFH